MTPEDRIVSATSSKEAVLDRTTLLSELNLTLKQGAPIEPIVTCPCVLQVV
jgi:hypothetical protein